MLLGYDENGAIQFIFTDDDYLRTMHPNNSAKISNFWKVRNHTLKELFIEGFKDINNIDKYEIINGELKEKKDYVRKKQTACCVENVVIEKKKQTEPKKIIEDKELNLSGDIQTRRTREMKDENRNS